ncbi:calcium/sodium antiporter [Ruficoccus amylovorans]|uniref:Calcium/sodium antiporter n=1 Tax=Ruficoccus amylovorans TaxID=1804625 RepID=A0A842HIP6_9BACT|nr:calcium/sodium antiporter [Ruficoccus amylovorans]MBC2595454.1 calcium/sodium antiporter [Ruficoccus amylovorans]
MLIPVLLVCLSLALLFIGAEGLVRGSSTLAARFGVSPLVIGLTVVAFGTSSPELVVSLQATLNGQGDITLGNVLGSNSFNIGIILGLTALICPIRVHLQVIRFDAPIALGVALALPLILLGGTVTRPESALLVAALIVYILLNLRQARKEPPQTDNDLLLDAPKISWHHWGIDLALIVAGLGLLIFGSDLLVRNAVLIARQIGVSDAVIGLTIIAAGTSMPELATSVIAALRRQPDIAIGNVVGSNIFNILGILGISGLVAPIHATGIQPLDTLMVIVFTVLLLPLLYTGRRLIRLEGLLLLAVYGLYLWMLWPQPA